VFTQIIKSTQRNALLVHMGERLLPKLYLERKRRIFPTV